MSKKTSTSDPFADREAAKYERPIPSREFILEHLKQREKPAQYKDLVEELNLKDEEAQEALHRRIKAMVRDDQLERLRNGYFWPAGNRILVTGRIQIEKGKKNKIWVIPENGSPRISLSYQETAGVYQGNRVVVSVLELKGEHQPEGRLVEILEQQRLVVTGRFFAEKGYNYVIPHSKEVSQDILIPQGKEKEAKEGEIVVVEIMSNPPHFTEPLGQIIEILGHEDNPGIEILAATRAYGLPDQWSEPVLEEINNFKEMIPATSKRDRLDLRALPLVTIDGEDAKDFDDAVYCEARPKGGWNLYVAIADVSHYVKPNTPLDVEAKLRGNSVYFPGKVIPMLPEILSNGLCSLKPEVDRLCLVCIIKITKEGEMVSFDFHEAIMHSKARLTYTKVAQMLEGKSTALTQQYKEVFPHLQELHQLYKILRKQREERGAIEFETIETRIIFGKNGKINKIEPVIRNEAHRIIEECMLCANVATAKFLKKHKLPGLYRIHEGPPAEKLADLKTFLKELGLSLGGGKEPKPLDYAKLLASIQKRKDANVIQTVLLRSLSQAVYSPDNVGHFGLAYPAYSHFTSPIRRYPDLLVHRQIRSVLRNEWTDPVKQVALSDEAKEALIQLANHTSTTERRADEATRDVIRWLKCEYIQKHIGEAFEGIISGVTRFGFFVELKELYIDGLVHIANLQNDYYYFDAIHHRLVGERTGIIYKLGDTVKVKVARVDISERKIDFELINGARSKKEKTKFKKQKEGNNRKDINQNKNDNKKQNTKSGKRKSKRARKKR